MNKHTTLNYLPICNRCPASKFTESFPCCAAFCVTSKYKIKMTLENVLSPFSCFVDKLSTHLDPQGRCSWTLSPWSSLKGSDWAVLYRWQAGLWSVQHQEAHTPFPVGQEASNVEKRCICENVMVAIHGRRLEMIWTQTTILVECDLCLQHQLWLHRHCF